MKCKYCGKELNNTATICDGCGAKVESVGINNEVKTEIIYNYPKNNNTGLKAIIVILLLIIIGGVGFGVWYFNSNQEEKNETEEKSKKEEKKEETPKENTIIIDKYEVVLPSSFSYYSYDNNNYIQNDECVITYLKYNYTYGQMLNNKETIINEFKAKGFNVTSYEAKNIDGYDCILVTGDMNDIEYGYLFTDIKNETPIYFVISSSTLGDFNQAWFNYAVQLVKNVK